MIFNGKTERNEHKKTNTAVWTTNRILQYARVYRYCFIVERLGFLGRRFKGD